MMKGVWADERDIADRDTLEAMADAHGLNGADLLARSDEAQARIEQNTRQAIETQVFGSPWYRIGNDNFWGQDRLDFVDKALAAQA